MNSTKEQKQKLREVGYELQEDKKTIDDLFDYHYSLLLKLKEQGQPTNLTNKDKIRINEDGTLSVIKIERKMEDGKRIQINKEEYQNPNLKTTGNWLYYNQKNFTKEQKQKLREVGYELQEDKKKNYKDAKNNFDEQSNFKKMSKILKENKNGKKIS